MSQQVEGQAPAHVGQPFELVAPEVGVEEYAVDEHGRWAVAGLEIGDLAEPGVHAAAFVQARSLQVRVIFYCFILFVC